MTFDPPVRDRARLIGPELSAEETARVAKFDAAPDAEESLRERVARAVADAQNVPFVGAKQRRIAVAAIAAMRGES